MFERQVWWASVCDPSQWCWQESDSPCVQFVMPAERVIHCGQQSQHAQACAADAVCYLNMLLAVM